MRDMQHHRPREKDVETGNLQENRMNVDRSMNSPIDRF